MRKRALKLALIGFLMGMVIGNLISFLSGGNFVNTRLASLTGSEALSVVLNTLLSGFLGAAAMGSTVVYEIERWPLAAVSAVHYLIVEISYICVALPLGWVHDFRELLIMLGIQLVIYFIIWMIMYLRYRRHVKQLNDLLAKSRETKPSEPTK